MDGSVKTFQDFVSIPSFLHSGSVKCVIRIKNEKIGSDLHTTYFFLLLLPRIQIKPHDNSPWRQWSIVISINIWEWCQVYLSHTIHHGLVSVAQGHVASFQRQKTCKMTQTRSVNVQLVCRFQTGKNIALVWPPDQCADRCVNTNHKKTSNNHSRTLNQEARDRLIGLLTRESGSSRDTVRRNDIKTGTIRPPESLVCLAQDKYYPMRYSPGNTRKWIMEDVRMLYASNVTETR